MGAMGAGGAMGAMGATGATGGMSAADIQAVMWEHVGLFRDRAGLERALQALEPEWTKFEEELRNGEPVDADHWRRGSILTVGRLIARAALRREESRGGHYRSDFPKRDDINWNRRVTEIRTPR
jgi:succinate dehydrogenase/fumarate reductase flavoprotein subunit